jgi:outer membrane beta-barrel protein
MRTSLLPAPILSLGVVLMLIPSGARAQESSGQESQEKSSDESTTTTSSGDESAAASKEAAETGEKKDESEEGKRKLSDRIKSVQRKVFIKKSRFEVFPHFAFDLNDPVQKHFIIGAAAGFHLADSASIELRGGYVFATQQQGIIRVIRQDNSAVIKDPIQAKYHADLDFLWAPIYGKISLFGEGILHFDTYLTAGPGIFGTDAGIGPAGNVGIGQRYFITDWLVARVELRDYIFIDTRNNESSVQNLLILGFALSGFFPTEFTYEYQ